MSGAIAVLETFGSHSEAVDIPLPTHRGASLLKHPRPTYQPVGKKRA